MNKESILNQIQEAESQIRRLKTLIQADDNDILNSEDNLRVGMYCCLKGKIQLENIQDELMTELNRISVIKDNRKEILIEIMRDSEEMGLYDDSFSERICKYCDEKERDGHAEWCPLDKSGAGIPE